jgi:hypothetical protein
MGRSRWDFTVPFLTSFANSPNGTFNCYGKSPLHCGQRDRRADEGERTDAVALALATGAVRPRTQTSNGSLVGSNGVSGAIARILKIAKQRLAPKFRPVKPQLEKLQFQRP